MFDYIVSSIINGPRIAGMCGRLQLCFESVFSRPAVKAMYTWVFLRHDWGECDLLIRDSTQWRSNLFVWSPSLFLTHYPLIIWVNGVTRIDLYPCSFFLSDFLRTGVTCHSWLMCIIYNNTGIVSRCCLSFPRYCVLPIFSFFFLAIIVLRKMKNHPWKIRMKYM